LNFAHVMQSVGSAQFGDGTVGSTISSRSQIRQQRTSLVPSAQHATSAAPATNAATPRKIACGSVSTMLASLDSERDAALRAAAFGWVSFDGRAALGALENVDGLLSHHCLVMLGADGGKLSTARLRSVRYRFFLLLGAALFEPPPPCFDFVAAVAPLIGGAAAFFVATAGMCFLPWYT
jgi:hypothetical protein